MAFPTKLLGPGEEIASETHPNWSVLIGPVFAFLVILAACISVVFLWGSAPIDVGYVLAVIATLAFLWLLGQLAAWRSRLLVITNRRVVYRWGILRRTGREIPLQRVQDVTYHQSILERLLGAGSLLIESAGAAGQEPFPDVRHPARLQTLINQLVSDPSPLSAGADVTGRRESRKERREREREETPAPPPPQALPPRWVRVERDPQTGELPAVTAPGGGGDATPWPTPSPTSEQNAPISFDLRQQLRDLEELHEAGVITDAEFDQKRRELLGF